MKMKMKMKIFNGTPHEITVISPKNTVFDSKNRKNILVGEPEILLVIPAAALNLLVLLILTSIK